MGDILMLVILGDQQFTYENNAEVIADIIQQINSEIEKENLHLSHLNIDGVDIYDDHAMYISDHIDHIQKIMVVLKTFPEFVHDLLLSTEEYIKQALPEVQLLVEELYQGDSKHTWTKFEQLIEGLQWIAQMISTIDQGTYQPSGWDQYMELHKNFQLIIVEMEEALQNKDTLLLGDIIQYEIIPGLKTLKNQVALTIDSEGKRYDLN